MPRRDQMQDLFERKVENCILSGAPQKPREFRDAVLKENWQVAGAKVIKKDNPQGITIRFDSLPQSDRVELRFFHAGYDEGVRAELEVVWSKYAYCASTSYSGFRPTSDGLERLVREFPFIAASMAEQLPAMEKKKRELEENATKRKKTTQMRGNAIKSWLSVLCEDLEFPYYIDELKTRFDLYMLMPDQTRAVFQIPVNHFEDVVTKLPSVIQQFVDIYKSKNFKVLVLNPNYDQKDRWITKRRDG